MEKYDGWLIYSKKGLKYNQKFLNTMLAKAEEYGVRVIIVDYDDFTIEAGEENKLYYKGEYVENLPNFVFVRSLCIKLARYLELHGVKCINNPTAMVLAKDKFRVHTMLTNAGFKTPKTIYSSNTKSSYTDFCNFFNSTIFVAKYNLGSRGNGVKLIRNEDDFKKIENISDYIFQEYIETTRGRDIRILVLDNEVIGSVVRHAADPNEFRANISKGGYAEAFDAPEKLKATAIEVAKLFDFDFTGVDFLFTNDGYTVCELNSIPAFKALNVVKGVRFSNCFYKYILKYKKFEK